MENLNANENSLLTKKEIIFYGEQFCELIFFSKNVNETIMPNESLVVKEWNDLLNNKKDLKTEVDNIGNRYYYMIKNGRFPALKPSIEEKSIRFINL